MAGRGLASGLWGIRKNRQQRRDRGHFSATHRNSGNGNTTGAGRGNANSRRGFNRGRNDGAIRGNQAEGSSEIVNPFGFNRLAEFLSEANDLVITSLGRSTKNFQQNLSLECPKDDMMILLIEIIGEKICGETSLHEIQNGLVAMAAEVNFLRKLKDFTLNLLYLNSGTSSFRSNEVTVDRSHLRILNALSAFYGLLCVRMTAFAVDNLIPSIQAAQTTNELLRLKKLVADGPSQELDVRLTKLLEELKMSKDANDRPNDEPKKKKFRGNMSAADVANLYSTIPEDKFWEMDIIPTTEEIISEEEPFLRPNLIKGKYPSALTYLDVQYRLLREDFVAPLRDSVKEYLKHEVEYSSRKKRLPPGTIRFYHDVKLYKVECRQEMTLFSMQFSTANLKRVKWEKSKRLLNGSLLLLSPDKFATIYFATVGRRDEKMLPEGIIDIVWEGRRPETYSNVVFLMIECEVYFESYRHTLKALQDMAKPCPPLYDKPRLDTYIMTKYIVDMTTGQVLPPLYLRNLPTSHLRMDFKMLLKCNAERITLIEQVTKETSGTDSSVGVGPANNSEKPIELLSFHANPLVPLEWPTAAQLGMDEPQYLAFKSAITQELSIIQGPPGTGKTYVGLQIMKLLLANHRVTGYNPAVDNEMNVGINSDFEENVEINSDSEENVNINSESEENVNINSDSDENVDINSDFEENVGINSDFEEDSEVDLYESPILVVCYTNHALDQFLEGIISIMRSLNIDPTGNLIRVGGMSKVEEVQQYNIREINRSYTKFRKFDRSYAQLRNQTRNKLVSLQNERADLKNQFRGLCHPEGIINFLKILENCSSANVRIKLEGIFPRELNKIFLSASPNKLINWLGMLLEDFKWQNFRAANLISNWFNLFYQKPKKNSQASVVNISEYNEDEEPEDGELRNILQAHRLEEEITMEDEKIMHKAASLVYFLDKNSFKDFNSTMNKLSREFNEAERTRDRRKLQCDMWQLQRKQTILRNQCLFLEELFAAYEDELIELPEVTPDLLQRGHETNAPLRPTMNERWALYFYFVEQSKKILLEEVSRMEGVIIKAQEEMQQVMNSGNGQILQKAKVVGMTTTGAAKYNTLLRMMKSQIVIVEEAAEVLESHIVTSITEHCEHLILIGDHKQLKPTPTVYKLAKDYNLDLSLFERLINNNLSWQYLRAQHRMRPEICKLLVPTIYKDLEDHSSVLNYPSIPGFTKNLFFVTHNQVEKADNDSMTKSNEYEAKYLAKLCRYLMLQGLKPGQVTILTTYIGQMFLIKKMMAAEGDTCRGVRVTVVDNFQGEENDIILLSLVRSNDESRIGFLKTENRICVALSRAKHGFYIVGNMDCLVKSQSNTWKQISQELEAQQSIGDCMKLKCQNHGDLIEISSAEDFQLKSPEGGCTKMCPGVLPKCSHHCRKICHIIDRDHKEYQCMFPCHRVCIDNAKHPCPYPCFKYPCPPCETKIVRELLCGHNLSLPCYVDYAKYKCQELVAKNLPCGHQVDLKCHRPVESFDCTIRVEKPLECGHSKTLPCNVPTKDFECTEFVDRKLLCGHMGRMKCVEDPEKFICNLLCRKTLPCGHEQDIACYTDIFEAKCQIVLTKNKPECLHEVQIPCHLGNNPESWKCISKCDTRLDCGHQCLRNCHVDNDPLHLAYKCRKTCARKCPNGLHQCLKTHSCYKDCDPCRVRYDKSLPCGHTLNLTCSTDVESVKCRMSCTRKVNCPSGHSCLKKCFEPCEPCCMEIEKKSLDCCHTVKVKCYEEATRSACNELVPSLNKSDCGHIVEVPCRIQNTCSSSECRQYCHQPCGHVLSTDMGGCGHPCDGDCSSCHQGRIHVKCMKPCGRILACGHVCKFPCSSLCPPCQDKCILRCDHSECKKKCGEPCTDCKERCKWSCEHLRCTKRCSSYCDREPCNKPCKKKLKCDHDCIGSCGEPCPPFCRICDQEIVKEILFGDEDEEDARFVYLEDCNHIIHRENMDKWMNSDERKVGEEKPKEIGVKRCPKCQTIITKSVRYGNILKAKLKEVTAVRNTIFGNAHLQKRNQFSLADKIMYVNNRKYEFESVRVYLESYIFRLNRQVTNQGPIINRQLVDVDQYVFESLHNIVLWWEEAEAHVKINPIPPPLPPLRTYVPFTRRMVEVPRRQVPIKQDLTEECRNYLIEKHKSLFGILLSRKLPLSHREINDFEQEFDRIHDLYRLGLRRGIDKFSEFNGAEFLFNEACNVLSESDTYDIRLKQKFDKALQNLETLMKSSWEAEREKIKEKNAETRANRSQIFSAMGFAGNHWYRCNVGHLYVVADCGAFNEAGQCPECRSSVGRGSGNACVRDENQIRSQIGSVQDELAEPPPLVFPESFRYLQSGRRVGWGQQQYNANRPHSSRRRN